MAKFNIFPTENLQAPGDQQETGIDNHRSARAITRVRLAKEDELTRSLWQSKDTEECDVPVPRQGESVASRRESVQPEIGVEAKELRTRSKIIFLEGFSCQASRFVG
jgi:hypothetical protein